MENEQETPLEEAEEHIQEAETKLSDISETKGGQEQWQEKAERVITNLEMAVTKLTEAVSNMNFQPRKNNQQSENADDRGEAEEKPKTKAEPEPEAEIVETQQIAVVPEPPARKKTRRETRTRKLF